MALTLGRIVLVYHAKRVLLLPVLLLVLSVLVVIWTHRSGWLSVGGAAITALGTWRWAGRLFRDPTRSDPGVAPMTLPDPQRRGPLVMLNPAAFNDLRQQAEDNWRAYLGVWISIAGGIIGSVGPFAVDLVWPLPR